MRNHRPQARALLSALSLALTFAIAGHALADGESVPSDGPTAVVSSPVVADAPLVGVNRGGGLGGVETESGAARTRVAFQLPKARGEAQPGLALDYNSRGGRGVGGKGWRLSVPAIERRNLGGAPAFDDVTAKGSGDFIAFDGAPLVPICTVTTSQRCDGAVPGETMPAWAAGWIYFRAKKESLFQRFFWSANKETWRVQEKGGVTHEFGVALVGPRDDGNGVDVTEWSTRYLQQRLRWNLVRSYDANGGAAAPANLIVYVWNHLKNDGWSQSVGVLADIFYTPALSTPLTNLGAYAHHVHLSYSPEVGLGTFTNSWSGRPTALLQTVDVTSAGGDTHRSLVRRYHLGYPDPPYKPALVSVSIEGRCASAVFEGDDGTLPDTRCPRLDASSFEYASERREWLADLLPVGPFQLREPRARLFVVDANGDGLSDFLEVRGDGTQMLHVNRGAGRAFETHSVSPQVDLRGDSPTPIFGDWAANGRASVVAGSPPAAFTIVVRGGRWKWERLAGVQAHIEDFKPDSSLADLNGDGLPDMFELYHTWGGSGSFVGKGRLSTRGRAGQLAAWPLNWFQYVLYEITQNAMKTTTGDINGDGLADMVKIEEPANGIAKVSVWPGRGDGTFEEYPRKLGQLDGAMHNDAPWTFVAAHDVNGDGVDELVTMSDEKICATDLGFIDYCISRQQIPGLWGYSPRSIQFGDLDGDGVDELIVVRDDGVAIRVGFRDSPGPVDLLVAVTTSFGAKTTIEYAPLASFHNGASFTSPVPTMVVKRIESSNGLPPRTSGSTRAISFSYSNPAYDGGSRELLGFRKTRVIQENADGRSRAVDTKYAFVSLCQALELTCEPDSNSVLSARRAAWGIPTLIETLDPSSGVYLETSHTRFELETLYSGLDGHQVAWAHPVEFDRFLYDTNAFVSANGWQHGCDLSDGRDAFGSMSGVPCGYQIRAGGAVAHTHSQQIVDAFGNVGLTYNDGRVDESARDSRISRAEHFVQKSPENGWLWRSDRTTIASAEHPVGPQEPPHIVDRRYDSMGRLLNVSSELRGSVPLERFHLGSPRTDTAPAPRDASIEGARVTLLEYSDFDPYGNPRITTHGGSRVERIAYDSVYADVIATRTVIATPAATDGLTTSYTFDRGLGMPLSTTPHDGTTSRVVYDGFGRVVDLFRPGDGATPSLHADYSKLPGQSVRSIHTLERIDANRFRNTWTHVDGWGHTVGVVTDGDTSGRIVSGVVARDGHGNALRVCDSMDAWPSDASGLSLEELVREGPCIAREFDAFGRVTRTRNRDGGVIEERRYHAMSVDSSSGSFGDKRAKLTTVAFDGHGRIASQQVGRDLPTLTNYEYQSTGELVRVTETWGSLSTTRWMKYDSLGRLVINAEPNTSSGFAADAAQAGAMKSWRYAYNDSGDLVGTSDARGCGKNLFYDFAGRLVAEDFSPCRSEHEPYTAPDLKDGSGTESFWQYETKTGRLSFAADRGASTSYVYDKRGRVDFVARQLAKPVGSSRLSERYAPHLFTRYFRYDNENRVVHSTTGADVSELLDARGESASDIAYTTRGLVASVAGTYGKIVRNISYDLDGRVNAADYADARSMHAAYGYDANRRVNRMRTVPTTGDLRALVDIQLVNDPVGNIRQIDSLPIYPTAFGASDKAVRSVSLDDRDRVTSVDSSNFDADLLASMTESTARHGVESFAYDGFGNMTESTAPALGTITNGGEQGKPHQLMMTTKGAQASYDSAGNLEALMIASGDHITNYSYEWDEVGRLSRAKCWGACAEGAVDERYAYTADGQRVRKTRINADRAERHSVDVFESLRLENARFAGGDYEATAATESVMIGKLARVVVRDGKPRVLLRLTDQIGSTAVVVDRDSGDIVERASYSVYGERTGSIGDRAMLSVAGYTGKQDDSEVGLVYFGARHYVPAIARWASADPLWVHALGGGPNPYAYVGGSPLQNIDPTGLQYEGPPPPDPPPGVNDDRGGDTYGNSGPGWGNGGGSGGSSGGGGGVHGNVPPEPSSMPSLGGVMAGVGSWSSRASASAGQWWQRNGRTVVTAGNFALNCALVVSLAVPVADVVTGSILAARLASAAVATEAAVVGVEELAAESLVGSRVFWSGGDVAKNAAAAFANATGGTTLEMTQAGRALEQATTGMPWETANPLWNAASKSFADGASGNISVFHAADGIRINSTWAKIEYRALTSNPAVTDITYRVVGGD